MKTVTLVVPGPLATPTGGSIYDRRIAEGLRRRGWSVSVVELDPIVHPLAPPLDSSPARFSAIPDDSLVLVDGLAYGTMPEIVEQESWRLRFVPIVHMALSSTPGVTRGEAAWLTTLERRALSHARHIVITGEGTRCHLRAMTQADARITRIPPGAHARVQRGRARPQSGPLRLLCVANLTWGKGYDILIEALASARDADWTLTCVGSPDRNASYSEGVRGLARELGVDSRVEWAGASEALVAPELERADIFVLPTRSETYGMAVAEAIAYGVPVISTRTGEIPTIVGDGGLLAEPGDSDGFAALVREALSSADLRARLASGARDAAQRLPTWDAAAEAMDRVLSGVVVHA